MIEFDVALTQDGKLVLMHDVTVDRTTDGSGAVADLTLAQLKALDAGSWKDSKFARERIPTLDEALSIMPENVWLNVHS
jgi:glycerophosphoryl diester phosphodiesterase